MITKTFVCAAAAAWLVAGCAEEKKGEAENKATPAASSAAPSASASAETKEAKDAPPAKPDYEKLADAVKFTQGSEKDGTFTGKLENAGGHGIKMLEYDAFAYDADGKLLERVEGKYGKALDAGASVEINVGPFKAAAGKEGVTVELVVGWMNVDGTSWQRPVPKDRAKGGPNNALKK